MSDKITQTTNFPAHGLVIQYTAFQWDNLDGSIKLCTKSSETLMAGTVLHPE
jgi:hypothetical protein